MPRTATGPATSVRAHEHHPDRSRNRPMTEPTRVMSNIRHGTRTVVVAAMVVSGLSAPRPAAAYSVLAHEANVDALWDGTIAPLLRARFPEATPEEIQDARAY